LTTNSNPRAAAFARHWFLAALFAVLTTGIGFSSALTPLPAVVWLRPAIIITVMFAMALPLRTAAFAHALRSPRAPILGVLVNFVLVPLLAWGGVSVVGARLGLSQDTAFGILVAATVPCTLASASVWTRRAGGNDAVSIMVTIVTNGLCFLVTPAWLHAILGKMPDFDPVAMVYRLGLLVVLPIAAAQLLRRAQRIGAWATENKTSLGVVAQCGVLLMVFLGAIGMGNRMSESDASPWLENTIAIGLVLSVHLAALVLALWLSRLAGTSYRDSIAVSLAGSQKTLPVGLEVCAQLGITILPIFAYHIGQLLADTVVADRLRKRHDELPPADNVTPA
jgi:sodium/bile acid cotransporter 7